MLRGVGFGRAPLVRVGVSGRVNESGFGASGYLAGKFYAVTHVPPLATRARDRQPGHDEWAYLSTFLKRNLAAKYAATAKSKSGTIAPKITPVWPYRVYSPHRSMDGVPA